MYFVKVSIYEEIGNDNCCDKRIDSRLIKGDFETEEEALKYVNKNEIGAECNDGEYACIEIEERDENGNVMCTMAVD